MSIQKNQLKKQVLNEVQNKHQKQIQNELISQQYPILQNVLLENRISLQYLTAFRQRSLETKELEELNRLNEAEFREFTKFVQCLHLDKFSKSESECIGIAQYNLGRYFHYVAKKQKLETALHWYLCAANNNSAEAQNKVGEFLEFNFALAAYPLENNQKKLLRSERMKLALSWYEKAKANNQVSVDAYYNLGRFKYFCHVYSYKMTELKYSEKDRKKLMSEIMALFLFGKEHGHRMATHYYNECLKGDFLKSNLYYHEYLINFRSSKESLAVSRAENPGLKPAIDDDLIFNPLIDIGGVYDKEQSRVLLNKKKLEEYHNEFLYYTFAFYESEAAAGNQLAMVRLGHFHRKGIQNDKFSVKKDLHLAYKYYKLAADFEAPEGIYWLIKIQIDNPNVEFVPNQSRLEWQLANLRRLEDSGIPRNLYVSDLFEQLQTSNIPRLIDTRGFELEQNDYNLEELAQKDELEYQKQEFENQNINKRFSTLLKACSNNVPKAAFKFWLFLVKYPQERAKINKAHSYFLETACEEEDGDAFYYLALKFLHTIQKYPEASLSGNYKCNYGYNEGFCANEGARYRRNDCTNPIHQILEHEEQINKNLLIWFLADLGLYKNRYIPVNYGLLQQEDVLYVTDKFQKFILRNSVLSLLRRASLLGSMDAQKKLVNHLFVKISFDYHVLEGTPIKMPFYRESLYWLRYCNVDFESAKQIFIEAKFFWPPGVINIILFYVGFDHEAIAEATDREQICIKNLDENLVLEEQYIEGLRNSVLEKHFPHMHKLKNIYDPLEYRQILAATKAEHALGSLANVLLLTADHYERMVVPMVHQEVERIDMLMSTLPCLPQNLIFYITAYERGFSCVSAIKKGFDLELIKRQLEEEEKNKKELEAIISVERNPITFSSLESQSRFPSFDPEQDNDDEFDDDFKVSGKARILRC